MASNEELSDAQFIGGMVIGQATGLLAGAAAAVAIGLTGPIGLGIAMSLGSIMGMKQGADKGASNMLVPAINAVTGFGNATGGNKN